MRIVMVVLSIAMLVLSINGCSSSSSAQTPRGPEERAVPVDVIIDFARLNSDFMLLNTQIGSQYDVWTQDIATGESSLLMEDARSLLADDKDNVWQGMGFLATPASTSSNTTGAEIWITDGTIGGTSLLVELLATSESFQLRDVHVIGDLLVFNVSEYNSTTEEFNPYIRVVNLSEVVN